MTPEQVEIERLKDELARERLARRDAERWLNSIKETLRPYWQDARSNWDGSLCGLPAEVVGVARKFAELEARSRELHGRIASLTARLSAAIDCIPRGITGEIE